MKRRRRLPLRLRNADAAGRNPVSRPRRSRGHLNPKPKSPKRARTSPPKGPRMHPKRSMVDRVRPGEAANPRPNIRLRVVGLAVAALFSLMLVRLWYLQVLDTTAYTQAVTANQIRSVEVPSPRGLILDRSGQTLVGNTVALDITLSRLSAEQHPEVVSQLASLLGIPPAQIMGDLDNTQYSLYEPVPILENAPLQAVATIRENPSLYPGVSASADTQRSYPLGSTGAQVLGYVGAIHQATAGYQLGDQEGLTGLEAQYESQLRGKPGVDKVEVNAQGQVVGDLGETPGTEGGDLVTNIDAGLEQTLQTALQNQINSLYGTIDPSTKQVVKSHAGAAVALDPQTGAVLAMVSVPTYDPSWWVGGISTAHYDALTNKAAENPLLNRAIDGLYTPGSTFKLATATAALQTGLITPDYTYDDSGSFTINGCVKGAPGCQTYHDNESGGGVYNVSQALTVSSDDFFYNIGVNFWDAYKSTGQYGEDPIQHTANAYGYGERTGVDLPGETDLARVDSPQVVAREHAQDPSAYPNGSWYTGNNLEMAFGQGGTVITPIEQALAYGTFANGGTRYVPQIAAGVVNPTTGKVIQRFTPRVFGHVPLSPADHAAILSGLEGVVQSSSGTAGSAFAGFPFSQMPLAGKTGTASVAGSVPTSWFVAFGPTNDPQYVIAAVIESGGYGATAAAPVVRAGFQYLINHPAGPVVLAAPAATVPTTTTTTLPACAATTTTTTIPGTGAVGSSTTTTAPCRPATTTTVPTGGSSGSTSTTSPGTHSGALRAQRTHSGRSPPQRTV